MMADDKNGKLLTNKAIWKGESRAPKINSLHHVETNSQEYFFFAE